MKPVQAALRSNAPAAVAPSASWIRLAELGKTCSGVDVATMTKSISEGSTSATSSARRAAAKPREAVVSSSPAMRRSRMPVRSRIQVSDVSTMASRSWLVSTRSGSALPQPTM